MTSIIQKTSFVFRMMTSTFRMLPGFLIIGGRGCGTTSLFNYLIEHPSIIRPLKKETHFFHKSFNKGFSWYKGFFPFKPIGNEKSATLLTGEASADYIFHPLVPKRISETLPNVKLIALLRNPVDRAYSDYQKAVRGGYEKLSFEKAIKNEQQRTEREIEKIKKNESYYSFSLWHHAYLYQSKYVEQLKIWFAHFPQNQILILKSEDFFSFPQEIMKTVFKFLSIPDYQLKHYQKFNIGNYPNMSDATRTKLIEYFEPYNEELYKLLKHDFGWNK